MRNHLTVATAVAITLSVMLGAAQEGIRLRFEVYKNSELVAKPSATVTIGSTGRLTVDGVGEIAFTPTVRNQDHISVSFDIESAGRQLKPLLTLSGDPGSISWSASNANDSFELRIVWVK